MNKTTGKRPLTWMRFAFGRQGFTLLEVMIAVSVLAIGFLGVYTLFMQSVAASDAARFQQEAAVLASVRASQWEGKISELSEGEGDFGDDHPGWVWRVTPVQVESKEFEKEVKRLKKVRLEVYRKGGGSRYQVTHYLMVEPAP